MKTTHSQNLNLTTKSTHENLKWLKLKKEYVGVVKNTGSSYNIQNHFYEEGYFDVKVSLLGPNLCLLEGSEDGDVDALLEGAVDWWKQRYSLSCLVLRIL